MTIKVKPLGIINRFNGIDVYQTCYYIKINNATYIHKILDDKKCTTSLSHHKPLPMNEYSKYNRYIETATPLSEEELHTTEK